MNSQAQELIRKMLTVEAQDRISMSEVIQHPWFKSQTPKFKEDSLYNIGYLDSIDPVNDIDMMLVDQLFTLGYEVDETLEVLASEG